MESFESIQFDKTWKTIYGNWKKSTKHTKRWDLENNRLSDWFNLKRFLENAKCESSKQRIIPNEKTTKNVNHLQNYDKYYCLLERILNIHQKDDGPWVNKDKTTEMLWESKWKLINLPDKLSSLLNNIVAKLVPKMMHNRLDGMAY